MQIKYVTLTGADNNTNFSKLEQIAKNYPYVEWGILHSSNKQGQPRYPTLSKLPTISHTCAHLCGELARNIIQYPREKQLYSKLNRIQVNCGKDTLQRIIANPPVWLSDCILGGNYKYINIPNDFFTRSKTFPLIDASGGRGISRTSWPQPFEVLTGYAGGLNTNNILEQLQEIAKTVGDRTIWIDLETGLRDLNDNFSLDKCIYILEATKKYV